MKNLSRSIALVTALAHLMAACAATPPLPPATPVARLDTDAVASIDAAATRTVALRIVFAGDRAKVLDEAGPATLRLRGGSTSEEYALAIEAGALAAYALPPGRYSLANFGRLECRGASFEVARDDDILLLGTVRIGAEAGKDGKVPVTVMPPDAADRADTITMMKVEPARLRSRPVTVDDGAVCQPIGAEAKRNAGKVVGEVLLGAALLAILLPLAILSSADFDYRH